MCSPSVLSLLLLAPFWHAAASSNAFIFESTEHTCRLQRDKSQKKSVSRIIGLLILLGVCKKVSADTLKLPGACSGSCRVSQGVRPHLFVEILTLLSGTFATGMSH